MARSRKIKKRKKLKNLISFDYSSPLNEQLLDSKFTNIINFDSLNLENQISDNINQNTVSAFSSWVFRSTIKQKDDDRKSMKDGKIGEEMVLNELEYNSLITSNNDKIDISEDYYFRNFHCKFSNEWERIYEDLSKDKKPSFRISKLTFENKPLYGKPDIVYKNLITGDILIVEVKVTDFNIKVPRGGWPNLQAQLWAYSWIDEFVTAKNIYLIADIRQRHYYEKDSNGNKIMTIKPSIVKPLWKFKRKGEIYIRKKHIKLFHEQNLKLFEMYGGKFVD